MGSQNERVNAALYLRLSRDDGDNLESMSIQHQRDFLTHYVNERGWEVFDVYIDDGYSGTSMDRPDFKRMVSDIEAGCVNCVVTKDLSRLARERLSAGFYREDWFPRHNVRYIAVNDGVDTINEDNDVAPFKEILNEMYAKDISKKVRSMRKLAAQQGKFMGSMPPYGYVRCADDRHKLVPDELAASVILRIFTEYADGDSGRNIAVRLNHDGVENPKAYYYSCLGKTNPKPDENMSWGSNTVMLLLKNPVYLGHMVQGRRPVLSFKTKGRRGTSPDQWIVVENTHEAIVDGELWGRVRQRMDADRLTSKSHNTVRVNSTSGIGLFSNIIRCADCGAAMAFNRKATKSGEHLFYRCSRYANHGKDECSMHTISQEKLEQAVLADMRHYAKAAVNDEQALVSSLMSASGKERAKEQKARRQSLAQKKNRKATIDRAVKQLYEDKNLYS